MTLRTRLLLALLALALIPTIVLSMFALDQIGRSVDRWYRPGVERALEAGIDIGKSALARSQSTLAAQSELWAARWTGALDGRGRDAWSVALAGTGVDFVQVYRRGPAGWSLVQQVVPKGVLAATPLDLAAALQPGAPPGSILRSDRGALAGVTAARNGDLVVAGILVDTDYFHEVDQLGEGATHYRQLGVTVDLARRAYPIVIGILVLLLIGIAWLLAHTIASETARPIQELTAAHERVARGDLASRVEPAGATELRSLGGSFNVMVERLAAARDAVQQSEREAVWRGVARTLAHEFKNMLTPMQLSLQLVEAHLGAVPDAERESMRRSLDSALREVDHLKRLAEQFSQYARLPEPNREPLDLAEIARAVAQGEPGAPLELEVRHAAPVLGDRLLLGRAVHNLVLNAREAGAGSVEVVVDVADGQAVLEVLDRGSGLPPEIERRLFEPYVSTKRRGSGLGLSLVRDIVQQHGGTVTLANRAGGGARATLTLPRRDAAGADGGAASGAATGDTSERTSA